MGILEIRKYPDSVLRKKCESVKEITYREKALFRDMLFTMHTFKGIGLAAPQIGIARRLMVAEIGEAVIKLADPEIVKVKGSNKMVEGCLSLPALSVEIKRPFEIEARGLNEEGRAVEVKAKGLMARVIQHEIDHLNGKLIIDYAGLLQRMKLLIRR
ncbi:MAG: peptide deformylase [Candidatus Omnitrophota bacterium]|nr:peptide deformylase [Candidatus Omnitrophota bacterium]